MSLNVRPMKAVSTTVNDLPMPCYAGVKFDGIRAIVKESVVLSLSLKPIRNKAIQAKYGREEYNGLDGELVVGNIYAPDVFSKTTSIVMASDKPIDDVVFYVFDDYSLPEEEYAVRAESAIRKLTSIKTTGIVNATALLFPSHESVQRFMDIQANCGGEGLIARKINSKYKYGRSTMKEGFLYKMKFYEQAEFKVLGFTEQMHNANMAHVNELGRTARSSSIAGLVPKGTLGALVVEFQDGLSFNCGTGLSDELRQEIWNNRDDYVGKYASVRYMATGNKDCPRHPVFISFRDEADINNDY